MDGCSIDYFGQILNDGKVSLSIRDQFLKKLISLPDELDFVKQTVLYYTIRLYSTKFIPFVRKIYLKME